MSNESTLLVDDLQQEATLPADQSPAVEDTPVTEETTAIEDIPATEETSATDEIPAVEDAPVAEEAPVAEDTLQPETELTPPADQESQPQDAAPLPYHERYYLRYHNSKRSADPDLAGTKAFLQDIGFDGGELRQARQGKNCAETLQISGKNQLLQMHCSYCGTEISGVDFQRLPDGRLRCTTCSSTVVKTKAEVEELCKRVISNMDNFFGATIDVPISIEVVDERKLKRKIGTPLGTRDDQSILILGVAINKKKKYSIILENGAPRISLIATFAHELTHIWQYTHWDNQKGFKKCPKSKRLLIYEGMAKWAEIQYLYLIGETTVARRNEYITRNRKDEYGIGFCLYEDRYPLSREAMICNETPFTPDRYPFD